MRGARAGEDHVGGLNSDVRRVVGYYPNLRPWLQSGAGSFRQLGQDFDGCDLSGRTDQFGQYGAVIARPGAKMQDRLAFGEIQRSEKARVQAGLAVVDAANSSSATSTSR